jgi:AraC family transcriptional regulator of adaptative response / DNA-3-methyladenine glycosylase II
MTRIPDPNHDASFDDTCYQALKDHDARFDGRFFTGVSSTGIYCRPVCRVRTPKRENCRFFILAAQAEQAGFRPCLRCRPELAPAAGLAGLAGSQVWSMQDASSILAQQAAQLLDAPHNWGLDGPAISSLAQRLGISDRHLRRIFEARFGLSPLRYLQTRRLLCAKQLLTDTALPVAQVAQISGFASVRRFNAVFAEHYRLNPTQLRRSGQITDSPRPPDSIRVSLAYRPPCDVLARLVHWAADLLPGTAVISQSRKPSLARTLRMACGQQLLAGWWQAVFDEAHCRIDLRVSPSLAPALPQLMADVRRWFQLDADGDPSPAGAGSLLPGAAVDFELLLQAWLGQQVGASRAREQCQQLLEIFGEPMDTPVTGLDRLFPSAHILAAADGQAIRALGLTDAQQSELQGLARAACPQPATPGTTHATNPSAQAVFAQTT